MQYISFIIISFILLSIQIYLGSNSLKDNIEKNFGAIFLKGFYRLIYIIISIIIYFIIFKIFLSLPVTVLFKLEDSVSNLVFLIIDTIRFVALFLVIEAIWELDLYEFFGFKQLWFILTKKDINLFKRNRIRENDFTPRGLYLRHQQPVYFYIILFFLLDRHLTVNNLVFLLVFIPYFYINTNHQEKRLLEDYGDSYQNYKSKVRKFIPMLKRYLSHEHPKK
ncbi:MAG: hypothetical protein A2Y40_04570 [Candidatus Margulisbacteria bacterium GWF2_35_9]|nr:MAG: hypothetical protein A2Y40_04570 [Candidatus Margulisbacteria bacterium GWF2_35_9]